jgi:hypothetical protein
MSVIERRLYAIDTASHAWRKQFFSGLPTYLATYFVERYIRIYQQQGARRANTFLREKMQPARERVRLVLRQYRHLPTTHKVLLLSAVCDDTEQNDLVSPQIRMHWMHFDAVQVEKSPPGTRSRILAELEPDELRAMAGKLSKIINARLHVVAKKFAAMTPDHTLPKEKRMIPEVEGYQVLADFLSTFGIKPPRKYVKQTALSATQDISKMISEKWLFSRLISMRKIMREHLAIAMGQVSAKASPYCSWDCLREHQAQQKRNWSYLEQHQLFDEVSGEEAELQDMVLKSVANPAIRRHELIVRCRGCEDIGNELGLQGLFLTLTAPSKYHNSYKKGGFVEHWNGASPRDAQVYLNQIWQRIRAKLGRENIRWFGVRVAEPHHDGTPHWHLLIWVKPVEMMRVRDIFITYATAEDRGELHPAVEKEPCKPFRHCTYVGPLDYRPRCDFGLIDPGKGSATGYIAKYIAKNIDGFAMDDEVSDETGQGVKTVASHVNAWKSRWHIRQFQFFGGAPVTTYRELRRFANQNKQAFMAYVLMQERADLIGLYQMLFYQTVGPVKPARMLTTPELIKIIGDHYEPRIEKRHAAGVAGTMKAADHGNWHGYLMGQGGPFVKRKDLLITNAYQILPFASAHGEDVRKIEGFKTPQAIVKTRLRVWTIRNKDDLSEAIPTGSAATDTGGYAASRSSVNNCTVGHLLSRLLEPSRLQGHQPSPLDERVQNALYRGSSVQIDPGRSIQIRPGSVDEHGHRRPAQLVDLTRQPDNDWRWIDFPGWEQLFAKEKAGQASTTDYLQPDLSFFPEREDWPLESPPYNP